MEVFHIIQLPLRPLDARGFGRQYRPPDCLSVRPSQRVARAAATRRVAFADETAFAVRGQHKRLCDLRHTATLRVPLCNAVAVTHHTQIDRARHILVILVYIFVFVRLIFLVLSLLVRGGGRQRHRFAFKTFNEFDRVRLHLYFRRLGL